MASEDITKSLILVVDDEPDLRNSLAELLQIFGYRTLTAENGEEGMRLYGDHESEVRLVLSDIKMPVMTGLDMATHMMAKHGFVPLVMLTAYGDFNYTSDALRLGAIDYLVKPLDAINLREKVALWLDIGRKKRRAQEALATTGTSARIESLLRVQNCKVKPKAS